MIAGIIGAAGYAGAELVRLLAGHPEISGLVPASVSKPGERIDSMYPNFLGALPGGMTSAAITGVGSGVLVTPTECIAASDIVFGALPAGTGEPYAKDCLDKGISYIDLSADFRFDDEETYKAWYGKGWQYPELRRRSVYGLPELNRGMVRELSASGPVIIGNPGCYPTAVSLACFPALSAGMVQGRIIADAVSGVTGAGREPGRAYHFPECADSVSPYKVGAHRHTPEISANLHTMAGRPVPLVFTPHLGPYNRGILATVYLPLEGAAGNGTAGNGAAGNGALSGGKDSGGVDTANAVGITDAPHRTAELAAIREQYRERYAAFYKKEPFVRVLPEGLTAATNRVRQSNYCDISVHLDHTGTVLIIAAAIDNMVKGAAGQAVQNMNILCGFDETAGLRSLPALF